MKDDSSLREIARRVITMKAESVTYEVWPGELGSRIEETGAEELRSRTKRYSLRVIRLFTALPKSAVSMVLGKQLLRSATSVGANYREACRSRSDAEFLAKLGDCLKELEESLYWLELMTDAELFPPEKFLPLLTESNELLAIFTTIAKTIRKRLGRNETMKTEPR